MYTNDSYSAEHWNEQNYRVEDIKTSICPTCNGEKKIYFSACCGEDIINGICTDCKKPCKEDFERCSICNGEGEVSE